MRRVAPGLPISFFTTLCSLALLVCPRFSTAQSIQIPSAAQQHGDTRATDDFASTGQITLQVQDAVGAPFFQGATVTLLTRAVDRTLSTVSDASGNVRFTGLPQGQYLVEVTATGYRTVREQILISGTLKAPNLTDSMLPSATTDKKAVKVKSAPLPSRLKPSRNPKEPFNRYS